MLKCFYFWREEEIDRRGRNGRTASTREVNNYAVRITRKLFGHASWNTESVSTWGFDTPCLCCDFGTGASCGCDVVQPGFWLLLSAGSDFGFIAMCCVKQQKEGGEVPPRVRGISLLVSVKACLHYQLLYCSVPGQIGFETRGLLSVFQNSHLNPRSSRCSSLFLTVSVLIFKTENGSVVNSRV